MGCTLGSLGTQGKGKGIHVKHDFCKDQSTQAASKGTGRERKGEVSGPTLPWKKGQLWSTRHIPHKDISSTDYDSASQARKMEAVVLIPVSKDSVKHKEYASS